MNTVRLKNVSWPVLFAALVFSDTALADSYAFSSTADATVQSVSPSSNYGSATTLETDGDSDQTTKEAYLKFAVSGVSGTVTSAIVRVYATDGSIDGPGIYVVSDNSWTESGITWQNRPDRGTKLQGKGEMTAGTFIDYDVTAAVKGNGTYSFGIAAADSDGAKFASRNASSNRPQLLIMTAAPAPSPTPVGSTLTTSGTSFVNQSFALQTTSFQLSFTATPLGADMNGVVGVSYTTADGYDDIAANVRFNDQGRIDARDGGGYAADASVDYDANVAYRFRMVIDPVTHRYSAYVTPPGGSEIAIGASNAFRTDQATMAKLNNLTARAETGGIKVTNIVLAPGVVNPNPGPSPTPIPSPSPTPPSSGDPLSGAVFTSLGSSDATIDGVTYANQSAEKSYSIMRSQHGGIYRFELHEGENRTGKDPSDRDRCELNQGIEYPKGTDLWASYSFMLEKGAALNVDNDPSFDNVFTQWHGGVGSPPLSIRIPKDNTLLVRQISGKSTDGVNSVPYTTTGFKRGTWYNIVQHAVFRSDGKGVIQIWINGVQVVNLQNVNTTYSDSTENYFKFGVYRDRISQVEVVYYANMEAGTKNLADRVAHPLPISP